MMWYFKLCPSQCNSTLKTINFITRIFPMSVTLLESEDTVCFFFSIHKPFTENIRRKLNKSLICKYSFTNRLVGFEAKLLN